jgi:hypothetical protein
MQQFVQRLARPLVLSMVLGLSAFVGAMTANALAVLSGSEVLDNVAPANGVTGTSIDRVLSDGIASQWGFAKSYPGTTQVPPPFPVPFPVPFPPPFDAYVISFAPNANQQVFYEIKWMASAFSPTSAAYLDVFDPMNVATNYLGDIGGVTMDALNSYQVIVPPGHSLAVAFLDDGQNSQATSYTFSINAFSDTNRGENFNAVPLPAVGAGVPGLVFATAGLLAWWRRKQKHAAIAA